MDLRRTAEMLLRAQPSVLPFLAPAFSRSIAARSSILSRVSSTSRKQLFSTTQTRSEDNRDSSRAHSETTQRFEDLLNSTLDRTKGVPTSSSQRTSSFKSASAQQENRDFRPPGSNAPASPSNISATTRNYDTTGSDEDAFNELLSAFDSGMRQRQARRSAALGSSRLDVNNMVDPQGNLDEKNIEPDPVKPLRVKLGPSLGRMIHVDEQKGIDVGRAFRMLEIQVARNKVKADFNRQRFHERPGMKRKRLKSVKWRAAFKEGFKGMVSQVVAMRRQGW
ncbi:hypothetical protein MBLNU457_5112t1 [Dothideomycetes sp. NU457]